MMKVQVVYDNRGTGTTLHYGWGFSAMIGKTVLFDTGEDGDKLLSNLRSLGYDYNEIQMVVISHDHWDHRGGLWKLLEKRRGLPVYICDGFRDSFHQDVKEYGGNLRVVSGRTEIAPGVFTIGPIEGEYQGGPIQEQAIALVSSERADRQQLNVVTGCAHPGVVKVVRECSAAFPELRIDSVLGGFHYKNKEDREIAEEYRLLMEMGVQRLGPAHCSGDRGIEVCRRDCGEKGMSVDVGFLLDV
ncbi:MAG: MBL fold metallo-hydrolase [Spirochaetales bacterium]|nr:MBL fold metallo-hydrolase [Spirochaetales bacterium]MCF7937157.1 MBL fold metallo-hydrolase [Spirochaetales bacterium]